MRPSDRASDTESGNTDEGDPVLHAKRIVERERMVERQLHGRGIHDARVLAAFRAVPRELFVDGGYESSAYDDSPLPIGEGQTISQPYVVAFMAEALRIAADDNILEVGAGSGYAAAVLGRLGARVAAIERHANLAARAGDRLRRLGYDNVMIRAGDGTRGWPELAPFNAILVSAGGREVPSPLLDQLAPGGRLVIPIGDSRYQDLVRITKDERGGTRRENLGPVMFVPLVGVSP